MLKNNQRLALVRVNTRSRQSCRKGGPFVEMRARVRFNCASGAAAPTTEWFYSRDHSGRFVVSKKATHDDGFGKNPEGGFADLVSQERLQPEQIARSVFRLCQNKFSTAGVNPF